MPQDNKRIITTELVEEGEIESFQGHWLDGVAEKIAE